MVNKMRIKKGDTVVVITGKDAGKKGKVLACDPKSGHVIVEKVNMVKTSYQTHQGGAAGRHH